MPLPRMDHLPLLLGLFAALLVLGCEPAASPTPTATPTLTASPTATATIITDTPRPTRTPLPTVTPVDTSGPPTETPTPLANQPQVEEGVAPPLDITLPDDWQQGYGILPVRDSLELQAEVPVAVYTGPLAGLEGATGSIVLLWGYPSISASSEPDPWADGLRFLRGALLDSSCNIGTDLSRYFTIGGREDAIGTYFQAVDCSDEPDTAGFFAGLNEQGGNYMFFVYVEPIAAFYDAQPALQEVLDSIKWHPVPTLTPAP